MNTPTSPLAALIRAALACLVLAAASPGSAAVLKDNFDGYETGLLTRSSPWPSPIPGTTPAQSWSTSSANSGTQRITAASSLGRTGAVYQSTTGTGDTSAYSYSALKNPYTGAEWTLSLDFYVADIDASTSAFTVVTLLDTDGGGNYNTQNRLAAVSVRNISGTYRVLASYSNTDGGAYTSGYFDGNVSVGQWYTLTITGSNANRSLEFALSNGQTITEKFYGKATDQIDAFMIGNLGSVNGTVYLDNFAVVPEPGMASLLLSAGVLLGVGAWWRKKRFPVRGPLAAACLAVAGPLYGGKVDFKEAPGPAAEASRAKWAEATRGENLALGRKVSFSKKPDYRLTVDDHDPLDLTSGRLSQRTDDRVWFSRDAVGWTSADTGVNLLVDLEAEQPVARVAIRLLGGAEQPGLVLPSEVLVVGSLDGKRFFPLARRRKVNLSEKELAEEAASSFFYLPEEGSAFMETFAIPVHRKVRYIGIQLQSASSHLFTDQLAIIKDEKPGRCAGLEGLQPVAFINQGISIRPRQEELVISTNIPTPNFFIITDSRPEGREASPRFLFELPKGIDLRVGPVLQAGSSKTVARRVESGEKSDRWVIEGLYHGTGSHRPFGPFYFLTEKGYSVPEGTKAVFSVDDPGSEPNRVEVPVRTIEIPVVGAVDDFDISLGWFRHEHQEGYPDYFSSFRQMGFNIIPTFPRSFQSEERWNHLLEFVGAARKEGFRILYNEGPFHVMWNRHKDESEVRNVVNGKPGRHACPSYTGRYYREEMERVARAAKALGPEFVFFDIEFWYYPALEAAKCSRCREAFAASGLDDWDAFLRAQGTRMMADLHRALAGSQEGKAGPLTGLYNSHVGMPVFQFVYDFEALYPGSIQLAQPSLYVRGSAARIHEVVRRNYDQLGSRQIIPWLTAGTYGEFPSIQLEQMILEAFLNGARGITYYTFTDFDPLDFYYHARALHLLVPYQKLLKNGRRIAVAEKNPALCYSAFGNDGEALVLLGNYGTLHDQKTVVEIDGKPVTGALDLHSGRSVELPEGEISLPPGSQRLLHVRL